MSAARSGLLQKAQGWDLHCFQLKALPPRLTLAMGAPVLQAHGIFPVFFLHSGAGNLLLHPLLWEADAAFEAARAWESFWLVVFLLRRFPKGRDNPARVFFDVVVGHQEL